MLKPILNCLQNIGLLYGLVREIHICEVAREATHIE